MTAIIMALTATAELGIEMTEAMMIAMAMGGTAMKGGGTTATTATTGMTDAAIVTIAGTTTAGMTGIMKAAMTMAATNGATSAMTTTAGTIAGAMIAVMTGAVIAMNIATNTAARANIMRLIAINATAGSASAFILERVFTIKATG